VVQALLQEAAQTQVFVQQLGIVRHAGANHLESQCSMMPQPKSSRMNFLTHCSTPLPFVDDDRHVTAALLYPGRAPWARGKKRFKVTPSSTTMRLT
jgi:hypothetical protein